MQYYKDILNVAVKAAQRGTELLEKNEISNIGVKEGHDIVTDLDLKIESLIIDEISDVYPNHRILSEEVGQAGYSEESEFTWVIDPIDGTINFANNLPLFTTAIALQQHNETILGLVLNHSTQDLYTAIKNQGAYKNNIRMSTISEKTLSESVVSFMLTSHYSSEKTDETLKFVSKLSQRCRGMRLFVSQAQEMCYVAEGKLDGYICLKSSGIGASAEALILKESGGIISNISGGIFDNNASSLVAASNSRLLNQIIGAY